MKKGLNQADSLNSPIGAVEGFVEKEHFPHGDPDDLQVLFPLKSFSCKTCPVSVDGKIVIQRKIHEGSSEQEG